MTSSRRGVVFCGLLDLLVLSLLRGLEPVGFFWLSGTGSC
jgi:hypothetical protein